MRPSPEDIRPMNATAIDISAQTFARRLEDREQERSGVLLPVARMTVARRTGVAAGTLENLRRGRIKGVREWIVAALRAALISEVEADIARAQHELTVLKASHRGVDHCQVAEVETSLASLRAVLRGE